MTLMPLCCAHGCFIPKIGFLFPKCFRHSKLSNSAISLAIPQKLPSLPARCVGRDHLRFSRGLLCNSYFCWLKTLMISLYYLDEIIRVNIAHHKLCKVIVLLFVANGYCNHLPSFPAVGWKCLLLSFSSNLNFSYSCSFMGQFSLRWEWAS